MPAKRRDPIVQELGIPLNARYYWATLDPLTGWDGLRLEVIGPEAEGPVPPDAFQWTDMFDANRPLTIIAWLRRVSCMAIPQMYLEMRWHPDRGTSIHLVWPSTTSYKVANAFRIRARQLLDVLTTAGGRPPSIEDKHTFWVLYWDAYQKVLAAQQRLGDRRPTKTEVAAELLISVKTLKRYRERHKLAWPPPSPPSE
jgi:hypothetical protein